MKSKSIYIGSNPLKNNENLTTGNYVDLNGESFYKISNYDSMDPFFMSIVSNVDHWMFISSSGSLTAGRRDPDNALFPYYTVDKIHDSQEISGSKTIIKVDKKGKTYLWEPFSSKYANIYNLEKNIYKNIPGNKIMFEEINHDLDLSFKFIWMNSEKYGFIRKSTISSLSSEDTNIDILDGIRNLLPFGVKKTLQSEYSTLVDAYKKNELDEDTGIGIYRLSSIPTDRAEPSEALSVTTVWSYGLFESQILLSETQLDSFRQGKKLSEETSIRAGRGAYFVQSEISLKESETKSWYIVAELEQTHSNFVEIRNLLIEQNDIDKILDADVAAGSNQLKKIVSNSDGLQWSNEKLSATRHFSNVMFNLMRGGTFIDNYNITKDDFIEFIKTSNKVHYNAQKTFFKNLPEKINYLDLIKLVSQENRLETLRLVYEYLPLTLSRRHGDPSRPWNFFSINTKNKDGSVKLDYQGNWRDIFQNWEALAISFPGYAESMVIKFLNAITIDGYNPYRVTRAGIDWEIPEPGNPWANIGYWNDHQVIYLSKLIELSQNYNPENLKDILDQKIISYANVPYRIKSYEEILRDPYVTIDFDYSLNDEILKEANENGSDFKLVKGKTNKPYQVNLIEKLLVILLAKWSNYVHGAGIWLNTQRPEWNDANNALVGNGTSMVSIYYLRRLMKVVNNLLEATDLSQVQISKEVADWFYGAKESNDKYKGHFATAFSDTDRKNFLDKLGRNASDYRWQIYNNGFSEIYSQLTISEIVEFNNDCLEFIDNTIRSNKRKDGLYHSYNLIDFKNHGSVRINYLYEMLEGQVAVLSSGILSGQESLEIANALKKSKMYREDQFSYLLYPDRDLPTFKEKNIIKASKIKKSKLLSWLHKENNKNLIIEDNNGDFHFNTNLHNSATLKEELKKIFLSISDSQNLSPVDIDLGNEEIYILDLYESVFDHNSFTGRSGTFFGYEGLGCIYWHMVSKLLLAIQESYFNSLEEPTDKAVQSKLIEHYFEIRAGIGFNKTPKVYGAFPTDPYSHTPAGKGAKQPGMTGQVKEDVISRFGELGIKINDGQITFKPVLLRKKEFCQKEDSFTYFNIKGDINKVDINKDELAFTFCQTPIIYKISDDPKIKITKTNESVIELNELSVNKDISKKIFYRTGEIKLIEVYLMPELK